MEDVEDAATKLQRYEWPCRAIAYVDYKLVLTYVNRLKIQTRANVVPYPTIIRVERLLSSNLMPVHSKITNGGYDSRGVVDGSVPTCCRRFQVLLVTIRVLYSRQC